MLDRFKLAIATIVTLGTLVTPVAVNAGALNIRKIFANKTFVCNNTVQSAQWQNTTGQTLYIKSVGWGEGYSFATNDFLNAFHSTEIKRVSDGMILGYREDRANNQTASGYSETQNLNSAQDYVTLANNDKIQISVRCLYPRPFNKIINVTIFYTIGSP